MLHANLELSVCVVVLSEGRFIAILLIICVPILGKPNENEARSVDARQELDLRIGCAFTRFQTKFFQGRYGDLDASLISYGPCQTPTLGFCVQRHDQIQTFKPETYWCVQVTVKTKDGQNVVLDWQRGRSFDKEVANMFLQAVKECKNAKQVQLQILMRWVCQFTTSFSG